MTGRIVFSSYNEIVPSLLPQHSSRREEWHIDVIGVVGLVGAAVSADAAVPAVPAVASYVRTVDLPMERYWRSKQCSCSVSDAMYSVDIMSSFPSKQAQEYFFNVGEGDVPLGTGDGNFTRGTPPCEKILAVSRVRTTGPSGDE
jgi:hypothetical protein